jgi:hypothetical protein
MRLLSQKSLVQDEMDGLWRWAGVGRVAPGEDRIFGFEIANAGRQACEGVIAGLVVAPHVVNPLAEIRLWSYRVDQAGMPVDVDRQYLTAAKVGDHLRLNLAKGYALFVEGVEVTIAAGAGNSFTPYYELFNAAPAGANVVDVFVPQAPLAPQYEVPNPLGQGGGNPPAVQRIQVGP